VIQVKEYNHIGIVVRDLEKSRWFYGEVLGLETIPNPPFKVALHWFRVGQACALHLMVYDETIPATMRHIALEVADFEEAVRELERNGIQVTEGPGKRMDGSDYLFCRDPDGNLVEITHR
jgi:glyoxylase I family protein